MQNEHRTRALELVSSYEFLRKASEHTRKSRAQLIEAIRAELGELEDRLDVVAFGSMAREEMHEGSDFDWLVVANSTVEDPSLVVRYMAATRDAGVKVGLGEPGSTGLFGVLAGSTELVNAIGLERDTNLSHTRRILMLQESVSLLQPDKHSSLRRAITNRYLHDQYSSTGIPRFLLNDILRYWRTVCVDYQAKRWAEWHKKKWAHRLLKLRSTRKLSYVGTVVSTFVPQLLGLSDIDARIAELTDQWELPSLARIAQAASFVPAETVHTVLHIANALSGIVQQERFQKEADGLSHPSEAANDGLVKKAHELTTELDGALQALLFSQPLEALSKKYLVL